MISGSVFVWAVTSLVQHLAIMLCACCSLVCSPQQARSLCVSLGSMHAGTICDITGHCALSAMLTAETNGSSLMQRDVWLWSPHWDMLLHMC